MGAGALKVGEIPQRDPSRERQKCPRGMAHPVGDHTARESGHMGGQDFDQIRIKRHDRTGATVGFKRARDAPCKVCGGHPSGS